MQSTINNFLEDLAKHPRWAHFKSEVRKKFNAEILRLKESIGHNNWAAAEKNYNQIIKKLTNAQKKVDLEVQRSLRSIKKSAAEVEKTIGQYKSIALKQKARVKKSRPTKKTVTVKSAKKTVTNRKKVSKA